MKEAIIKSIEGGWQDKRCLEHEIKEVNGIWVAYTFTGRWQEFCLDPLFWQCLGKALGWDDTEKTLRYGTMRFEWQHKWHYFIDWIAEGKDENEFFSQLFNKN